MIYEININNTKNSNFSYVSSEKNKTKFKLPENIVFKKGKNVLIGENGCGKSTLLNIIAEYTFCRKNEASLVNEKSIRDLFLHENKFGIDVKCNYSVPTYKTLHEDDKNESDILSNFKSFSDTVFRKTMSSGEKVLSSLNSLMQTMFSGENVKFDKDFLNSCVNDVWKKKFDEINAYFQKNNIHEDEPIYTILLDEPDRNLSIKNVKMLYTILSSVKHNEQMICAIHNPALIYKLSKLEHINFIELTNGYLKSIINFMK